MNFENFINSKTVENLGWTLLHSIWQIALIACVLFVLSKTFRAFSANSRYFLAVFALGLAVVLSVTTFARLTINSDLNHLQNINVNSNFKEKINRDFLQAEDFSTPGKNEIQIGEITDEKPFISIENLQNFFNKNLAAVLTFNRSFVVSRRDVFRASFKRRRVANSHL